MKFGVVLTTEEFLTTLAANSIWGRTLLSVDNFVLSESTAIIHILTGFFLCVRLSKLSRHQILASEVFENTLQFRNLAERFCCRPDTSLFSDIDSDCIDGFKRPHSAITNLTARYTEINAAGSILKTPSGVQMCPTPCRSFRLPHSKSPPQDVLIYILQVQSAV